MSRTGKAKPRGRTDKKKQESRRSPTVTTAGVVAAVGAAGLLLAAVRRARASRALRAGQDWDADVLMSEGADRN